MIMIIIMIIIITYDDWMQETTQRIIKLLGLLLPDLLVKKCSYRHSECCKTKLIARLVLRQKGKILLANISTSRTSVMLILAR